MLGRIGIPIGRFETLDAPPGRRDTFSPTFGEGDEFYLSRNLYSLHEDEPRPDLPQAVRASTLVGGHSVLRHAQTRG